MTLDCARLAALVARYAFGSSSAKAGGVAARISSVNQHRCVSDFGTPGTTLHRRARRRRPKASLIADGGASAGVEYQIGLEIAAQFEFAGCHPWHHCVIYPPVGGFPTLHETRGLCYRPVLATQQSISLQSIQKGCFVFDHSQCSERPQPYRTSLLHTFRLSRRATND